MSTYNGNWKLFEGVNMAKDSLLRLLDSKEKDDLIEINEMMIEQGFDPESFWLIEIPINGVYCFDNGTFEYMGEFHKYFSIGDNDGVLTPTFTTIDFNEDGYNCFYCKTIQESIDKTEM